MEELLGCMISEMRANDYKFQAIAKMLNQQCKFNRKVAILSVLTGIYVFKNEKRFAKQKMQIEKLQKEIDEMKGE